jgi:(4S)-4-hydroxy-5-phosphonooxypentane-2,3-dione isomerase
MIVTCVHIKVKKDLVDRFISATTDNHRESVKEQGNLRFDVVQMADDPTRFMLYEAYESEQAAAEHKLTPHYAVWRDTVADFMAEPRKGIKYKIIEPDDPAKW